MPFPGDAQWRLDDFAQDTPFPVVGAHVQHPLLRSRALEARPYQVAIAERAIGDSLLAVLPTGLGKTAIAALVAAERLHRDPAGKVVVVAPTRPLVQQHAAFLRGALQLPEDAVVTLAGHVTPARRVERFDAARVIVSTPQGLANDVAAGRLSLERVALLVVDEAHRAVGDYAYVPLAHAYRAQREDARVLGLTASPGGRPERVRRVLRELAIERVEVREAADEDVRPYVRETRVDFEHVSLPAPMEAVRDDLQELLRERVEKLKPFLGRRGEHGLGKGALLDAGDAIRRRMHGQGRKGYLFGALHHHTLAVQALHAVELLETQGMHPLRDYLERLEESEDLGRAQRAFLGDPRVQRALREVRRAPLNHPKDLALLEAVAGQFDAKRDSRILVFAQYRSTVQWIVDRLREEGFAAERFVGQADRGRGDDGLDQDAQARILQDFRNGVHQVVVATSVAEEGLHVPSVDLVVFYEPVVSEIRTIQRRGRTGRDATGRVLVLVTEDTRDEAFLQAELRREREMRRVVGELAARTRQDSAVTA